MFIVFEGHDGIGKSTTSKKVLKLLNKKFDVILTKEPFGTRIKKIKKILSEKQISPKAQFLFFEAERIIHCNEIIIPNLEKNKIVLSDRFFDSSIVYQGLDGGLNIDLMIDIHKNYCNNIIPDMTFFLYANKIDLEKRIKSRKIISNFDEKVLNNLEKFKKYYETIYEKYQITKKLFKINTSTSNLNEVSKKIFEIIKLEIEKQKCKTS